MRFLIVTMHTQLFVEKRETDHTDKEHKSHFKGMKKAEANLSLSKFSCNQPSQPHWSRRTVWLKANRVSCSYSLPYPVATYFLAKSLYIYHGTQKSLAVGWTVESCMLFSCDWKKIVDMILCVETSRISSLPRIKESPNA